LWGTTVTRNGRWRTLRQATGWRSKSCRRSRRRSCVHWWRHIAVIAIWWSKTSRRWRHSARWHCPKHLCNGDGCALRLYSMSPGLCSKSPLGIIAMTLAFAVFLVCVLYRHLFVHEILTIHIRNRCIRAVKVSERDKAVAFREVRFIAGNLVGEVSFIGFAGVDCSSRTFGAVIKVPNLPNVS
jgi:hypothetical protein